MLCFFYLLHIDFSHQEVAEKSFPRRKVRPSAPKGAIKTERLPQRCCATQKQGQSRVFPNLLERAPPTDKFWRITLKTMPKIVRSRADQAGGQLFSPV
jgi:hypothetical protein